MEEKKEFYGFLWLKGMPEDIDAWLEEEGYNFARQFYVEECNEEAPEHVLVSEEQNGLAPWFDNMPTEEGMVIRNYQLGEYYWTEDNEPLDMDKIDSMADLLNDIGYCIISVEKEDYDENEDDAKTITRSFFYEKGED